MRKYLSSREIQLAELDMLCELTEYLDQHQIHYILGGGTMLGAVRHNGFIPWDDDIDILIKRDHYNKLMDLARINPVLGRFRISIPGNDKHIYPFIKVIDETLRIEETTRDSDTNNLDQCLWIDIFPLDHYPDDEAAHKRCLKKMRLYMKLITVGTLSKDFLESKGYYKSLKKKIGLYCGVALAKLSGGYRKISVRMDHIADKMNRRYSNSNHVGDGTWPNGMNDYFELHMVEPTIKHVFEGKEFNIPENYDGFLTRFYGNYMQIPPVEQRVTHEMKVYKVEKSRVEDTES